MRDRRFMAAVVFAVVGALMLPVLPAAGDTAGVIAFAFGKATVQCPPDGAGNTGIAAPGLGINKGKKCGFSFSSSNAHFEDACVGAGVADPLKKGNKKAPQVGLCTITATGVIGPRLKWPGPTTKIPNDLTPDDDNLGKVLCALLGKTTDPGDPPGSCDLDKQQQFAGPWCGASQGESGSGTITTGIKLIDFDRLRFQSQGSLIVITASGFKPGMGKPGQAGPVVAVVNASPDTHKAVTLGLPASCLTQAKHFSVHGIAAGLLLGVK